MSDVEPQSPPPSAPSTPVSAASGATSGPDASASAPADAVSAPDASVSAPDNAAGNGGEALLEVEHLRVLFPIKSGVIIDRQVGHVHAVDDVSFTLHKGETLGIVGESGCGKTTLIRVLVRLLDPTSGSIRFRGTDITSSGRRQLEPIRKEMQMVFQDPQASLNPRKRVGQILSVPLRLRGVAKDKLDSECRELLAKVGLQREALNRFPHEFSGGQRQRIGIARGTGPSSPASPPTRSGHRRAAAFTRAARGPRSCAGRSSRR